MGIKLVSVVFGLVAVTALSGNPTVAACMTPPLSFEAIDQFKLNPRSLIPSPSTDRRAVEASTRDLAATEPQLAPDLVHVAQTAQRSFQGAIAAGLAQAELACRGVDQQAVAGFEDGQFQAMFAAVVGDPSTAATDAAISAATGSAGSVVIINPNRSVRSSSSPGGGSGSSTNTAGVFGVAGPNQFAGGTITVGRTAAVPVSSTR
jgi:hypothetical protein